MMVKEDIKQRRKEKGMSKDWTNETGDRSASAAFPAVTVEES